MIAAVFFKLTLDVKGTFLFSQKEFGVCRYPQTHQLCVAYFFNLFEMMVFTLMFRQLEEPVVLLALLALVVVVLVAT